MSPFLFNFIRFFIVVIVIIVATKIYKTICPSQKNVADGFNHEASNCSLMPNIKQITERVNKYTNLILIMNYI